MYYGDGAGTRRKLIDATVTSKMMKDPIYATYFRQEYAKQDMGEHAMRARKERERRDHNSAIMRNAKGLATGNINQVSPVVLFVVVGAAIAHKTGLDKKALDELKVQKHRFDLWRDNRRRKRRHLKPVKEA